MKRQISLVISVILHPFVVGPMAMVLVLYLDSGNLRSALWYAAVCAALVIGPTFTYLLIQVVRQRFSNADVSIREQRHGLYIFGVTCMLICLGVLLWLDAPRVLVVLFLTGFGTIAAFAVITKLWTKVSIHAGTIAGTTAAVAFYSLPLAGLLALGTFLVSWSRLTLKRHTLFEVMLGLIVATTVVVVGMTWR